MSKHAENVYLKRKLGEKMGFKYLLSSITPLILVFLIVGVLSFSLTFIISFSDAIDRMIVILGSGSISTYEEVPLSMLPEGSSVDYVKTGEGILYSENGESLAYLKGFDEGYFDSERGSAMNLVEDASLNGNTLYVSASLSRSLSLEIGDRLTLLLYEEDKNRTRPLLMTIKGVFDSGYAQLDKYLAYVDNSVLSSSGSYEVLIPAGEDVDEVSNALIDNGIFASTYKENYSALYTNVQSSIQILYIILLAVALLSAFFSSDIARVYLDRDKMDIAALMMLGMEEKRIRLLYSKLTLISVLIASLAGTIAGIALSHMTPWMVGKIAEADPALLEYYITGFEIRVPYLMIGAMIVIMLLISYVTLHCSMKRIKSGNLASLVENE
ncbi:MAG: hypothetical protein J6R23_04715 [Spirochaetales bacterium]|nr:hypothetical protein [Spirochaetales bacterium]